MDGNPADRPPDLPIEAGNPTIHAKIHEVAESASSSSSQRREEAVHVATIEADIDASRHNVEQDYHLNRQLGATEKGEEHLDDGKITSQDAAAKSISTPVQSHNIRQESRTGESSLGQDSHSQQIGEAIEDRIHDSRQESQTRNRDGQNPQVNRSAQNQQRNPRFNKEKEMEQHRNPNSNKGFEIEQQNPRSTRPLATKDAVHITK